jgi:hypothetical protein
MDVQMDVQEETSEIRELKADELDEVAGGPGFVPLPLAPVGPCAWSDWPPIIYSAKLG